jgi:hypothetical protein
MVAWILEKVPKFNGSVKTQITCVQSLKNPLFIESKKINFHLKFLVLHQVRQRLRRNFVLSTNCCSVDERYRRAQTTPSLTTFQLSL